LIIVKSKDLALIPLEVESVISLSSQPKINLTHVNFVIA
jgi:hypothetical protein